MRYIRSGGTWSNAPKWLWNERPGPTNTGPDSSITLTVQNGDITLTGPNQIVENLDIYGRIKIPPNCENAIIRNCIIRGPGDQAVWPTGETAMVTTTSGASDLQGALISDCKLTAEGRENVWVNGVMHSNVKLLRTEITRTCDGVGLTGELGAVQIIDCWIHDGFYDAWPDGTANKPGWSDNQIHGDGIQIHRGKDILIRGCTIGGWREVADPPPIEDPWTTPNAASVAVQDSGDDYPNAAIMIKQEVSADASQKIERVIIENNWLAGGSATVNLGFNHSNDLSGVSIRSNVFDVANPAKGDHPYIVRSAGTTPVLHNNTMADTRLPVGIKDW